MSDKKILAKFSRSLWLTVLALFISSIALGFYINAEKKIDSANELRFKTRQLTDELRQSSDALTSMARSYVVTGNPLFKQRYLDIIDIRDGKKPRTEKGQEIYWDLALDKQPVPYNNKKISLLALMRLAGFTKDELSKLEQSKARSDDLTKLEFAAMQLSESSNSVNNRLIASKMLQDIAYHQLKAKIMRPIAELYQLLDKRTLDAVHHAEHTAKFLRYAFIILGLFFLLMIASVYRALHAVLGSSAADLHKRISSIGQGDFVNHISVPNGMENSVIGWLSETQIKLSKIDADRKQAEEKNLRMSRLYAALSQCNQAILLCSNEAELFAEICKDAVVIGGFKLAWVGLADLESKHIRVAASYGDKVAYLNGIEIKTGLDEPYGRGPTASAFQENKPYWCQDFQNDPVTSPWKERAALYDLNSCAALPLHRNGIVIGTFTLYADKVGAFDEDVHNLLIEMSTNIDFALHSYDLEAERQRSHLMEDFRTFMLEHLTGGISLNQLLQAAVIKLEAIELGSICSILFLDDATQRLSIGAAPNLPDYYNDAIEGLKASAGLGSCGNTAFTGKRTVVENISNHPFWENYKLLAHKADLASCWSEPIITGGNKVIGTFAIYHREPSTPDKHSFELLEMAAHFIAIAIERKNAEVRIQYLAHFDTLTGLPNRETLEDRARYSISLAKRSSGHLSVMFLDLDHFKDINDSLGHRIGDALLIKVANRLKSLLREEDTISRLGGDEFIFLLPSTNSHAAAQVANKLLAEITRPYQIEQYELIITASVGVAIYPNDGSNLEELSKSADIAMYSAKQGGRNAYSFFTSKMQASSVRNMQLVSALRQAQALNQLELHYQPQLSLDNGSIIGAEALLRWKHPEFGSVSPDEFIPLAEDSGLIQPIGEWVIREATRQAKSWMDSGLTPIVMAVNLSAVQFRHANLTNLISRILDEVGLPAQYLELELTEGVAMQSPQAAIEIMNNLHSQGIQMSIDDFGTGYSSLSYLKKFKVYKLKIDQSFIRDICSDAEDKALVSAIISMARSLGLQTIAEGVETNEQMQYLIEQGCNEVQGYLFSKPLPANQFEQWLREKEIAHFIA